MALKRSTSAVIKTQMRKLSALWQLREDGSRTEFDAQVRIDTPKERDYYEHGGILALRAETTRRVARFDRSCRTGG